MWPLRACVYHHLSGTQAYIVNSLQSPSPRHELHIDKTSELIIEHAGYNAKANQGIVKTIKALDQAQKNNQECAHGPERGVVCSV